MKAILIDYVMPKGLESLCESEGYTVKFAGPLDGFADTASDDIKTLAEHFSADIICTRCPAVAMKASRLSLKVLLFKFNDSHDLEILFFP